MRYELLKAHNGAYQHCVEQNHHSVTILTYQVAMARPLPEMYGGKCIKSYKAQLAK